MTEQDYIRSLGLPFLAHRLRRASELILEGTSAVRPKLGIKGPARSASTLLLLREHGPMGVTEIAYRLRLSHPLLIKLTGALAEEGLVTHRSDPKDNRRRLISLTQAGVEQAERISEFTVSIGRMLESLFGEMGVDLLDAVERLEAAAERRPIDARMREELGLNEPEEAAPDVKGVVRSKA